MLLIDLVEPRDDDHHVVKLLRVSPSDLVNQILHQGYHVHKVAFPVADHHNVCKDVLREISEELLLIELCPLVPVTKTE